MEKFRQIFKDHGLGNGLWFIVNRVFAFLSPSLRLIRYYFVVQPVSETRLLPERFGHMVRIHEIAKQDATHIPWPRPHAVIEDRFRQGGRCLIAYRKEIFAGYLWFIAGHYMEDEVRCRYALPNRETVWDFDMYVEPAHRSSPIFALLWDKAFSIMRAENITHTMSRISVFNPTSLASHRRLGSKPMASGTFFCLGRAQISLLTVAPYFHMSMRADHYPTLRFAHLATPEKPRPSSVSK